MKLQSRQKSTLSQTRSQPMGNWLTYCYQKLEPWSITGISGIWAVFLHCWAKEAKCSMIRAREKKWSWEISASGMTSWVFKMPPVWLEVHSQAEILTYNSRTSLLASFLVLHHWIPSERNTIHPSLSEPAGPDEDHKISVKYQGSTARHNPRVSSFKLSLSLSSSLKSGWL